MGWNWDRLTALRQGHWEEDAAEGALPKMSLKRLWYGEGEESETHSSTHHPSMRGVLQAEVPRMEFEGNPFGELKREH